MHYVTFPFLASKITLTSGEGDGAGVTAGWDGWQARDHCSRRRFGICAEPLVTFNETSGQYPSVLQFHSSFPNQVFFFFFVPKPNRKKRTLPTFILALEFPQNDGTWVHPVFATDWFTSAQINCTKENAPNVAGVRSPEGPLESAGAPLNLFFWLCGGICHLVCSSLLGQQTERD